MVSACCRATRQADHNQASLAQPFEPIALIELTAHRGIAEETVSGGVERFDEWRVGLARPASAAAAFEDQPANASKG